jgi:O-6-methylguanine DNA methyltransferase
MTYKQVAMAAGNPGAARAVGAIMKTNFNPDVPCHRVIRSDGKTGGYNRGADRKIERLRQEGAIV